MAKWLKRLGKEKACWWLAVFVVSWIVCDGCLHKDYIIILVAAHVKGSKGCSIPNWMEDVLRFLLGNEVYVWSEIRQKEEWNKPIAYMRISRKKDRLLFGKFLTPHVSEKCGLDEKEDNDDDEEKAEENKVGNHGTGFMPYYKWNALVRLEELYYAEGGDPNCQPDNEGAWEKLISLDPTSW